MGQAKTKFDCPLCASQPDQDDGCDSPPPIKPDAPFAISVYVPDDVTVRSAGSGVSGGQYVAVPLTSVAEEPSTSGDMTADGDVNAVAAAPGGHNSQPSANHSSSAVAVGRQPVVMRGNIRHHGSGGHRVR
jgi:hypothetical protein